MLVAPAAGAFPAAPYQRRHRCRNPSTMVESSPAAPTAEALPAAPHLAESLTAGIPSQAPPPAARYLPPHRRPNPPPECPPSMQASPPSSQAPPPAAPYLPPHRRPNPSIPPPSSQPSPPECPPFSQAPPPAAPHHRSTATDRIDRRRNALNPCRPHRPHPRRPYRRNPLTERFEPYRRQPHLRTTSSAESDVKVKGLKQKVIVVVVEQCHFYKQRVEHLVNITLDEELLCQGFALNDDLSSVLAKHDAIVSGVSICEDNLGGAQVLELHFASVTVHFL